MNKEIKLRSKNYEITKLNKKTKAKDYFYKRAIVIWARN